jgi:hypothetical protein
LLKMGYMPSFTIVKIYLALRIKNLP